MSKLMIRGGYGEHGRSCFLVEMEGGACTVSDCQERFFVARGQSGPNKEREKRMYMVDCGIMDTDPFPYSDVAPEELARVDYLFLTHCHKDHSGAFEYFRERGFCGTLVTTRMTCLLAGIQYEKTVFLDVADVESKVPVLQNGMESVDTGGILNCRQFGPLTVRYGRTGHCPGGLWFEITDQAGQAAETEVSGTNKGTGVQSGNHTILFSGDYQEDTLVYRCDPIRGSQAKLALLDCAHRGTELGAEELRAQIVRVVSEKIKNGQRVILPVPQYGRGLELLVLMKQSFPKLCVRVDRDFLNYAKQMLSEKVWYYEAAYQELDVEAFDVLDVIDGQNGDEEYDILLLADTHLKKQKNVDFVHHAIGAGDAVLINGRVKKNGPVGKLLDAKKAERFLFPHHQSYGDLRHVVEENHFDVVLPFHNNEKEILI